MKPSSDVAECPAQVADFAAQAVEYVRRAVGLTLEFDSDTLPLLDHYLRTVPEEQGNAVALVAATAGAYFGEVVRRALGGAWQLVGDDASTWRLVLPGGLSFLPARLVLSVICRDDGDDGDPSFQAPPKMWPVLEAALERMGQVSEDEYYSVSCRLDTLEHLQAVLLATAAARAADDEKQPDKN